MATDMNPVFLMVIAVSSVINSVILLIVVLEVALIYLKVGRQEK